MRTLTVNDRRFGFATFRSLAVVPAVSVALGFLVGLAPASSDGAEAAPAAASEPAAAPNEPAAAPAPAAAQPAPAQRTYVPLPMDPKWKNNRLAVMRILRSGNVAPDQEAAFDAYYKQYALPLWTQPDQLRQLPTRRKELLNELKIAKSGAAHDRLVALTLDFLGKMAKAKQPPASRVNAMLAIAELNSVESPRPTELPVPLPAALDVLKATLNDPSQIDAVRIAALLGIYRHTVISMAGSGAPDDEVSPMMLALTQSAPPAGRSVEGHAWMRAQAMKTLAQIKGVGTQNAVVLAMAAVVADQADLFLARSTAAWALGNLEYQGSSGLDPSDLSVKLAQLAFDAGMAELTKMEEEDKEKERKRQQTGRPGFGVMGSGMGMMYGAGEEGGSELGPTPGGAMGGEYEDEMMGTIGSAMMGSGFRGRARQEEEEEEETLANRRRLMDRLSKVFFGFTQVSWNDWRSRKPDDPLTGGVATLASDDQAVNKLLDRVKSLLTLSGAQDKEGLLGIKEKDFTAEQEEASFRELFRGKLQNELTLLREAISEISPPAAAPPPATTPPATTPPAAAPPPGNP